MISVVFASALLLATLLPAQESAPKLSEHYGKMAFLALKAIERDNSENGDKFTKKAIDEADVEASSQSDKAVTAALNRILLDHLLNNRRKGNAQSLEQVRAIADREKSCFEPFEESLRARSSAVPDACSGLAKK